MVNLALRWSPENLRKAKKRLGVMVFRPSQEELIETVMKGEDALGILPTGGGKSLCYQLPALFLSHSVVVVSPLISLMKDQQDKFGRSIHLGSQTRQHLICARRARNGGRDMARGAGAHIRDAGAVGAGRDSRDVAAYRRLAARGGRGPLYFTVGARLPSGVSVDP
jgi:hypothetical protein